MHCALCWRGLNTDLIVNPFHESNWLNTLTQLHTKNPINIRYMISVWFIGYEMTERTFFFALQWQQTVHRYLRVLHSRIMKRPPKKVTMEEARKAHHIRWPLLSQCTSWENGMIISILDMWMDGSGLNLSLFFDIIDSWTPASPKQSTQLGIRRFGELQPAPPDATAAQPCWVNHLPLCFLIWLQLGEEKLGRDQMHAE